MSLLCFCQTYSISLEAYGIFKMIFLASAYFSFQLYLDFLAIPKIILE